MFKELIEYRDLLYMLTVRDIRIRYKQAVMGFLWALFMPVVAVAAGILIKKSMAVVSGRPVDMAGIVSISVKVLPWTFFISSIRFCVQSLVGNSSLVTKIYFPREVLPLAAILACFFDFGIAILVLSIFLIVVKIGLSSCLFFLPVILFALFLFTAGVGIFLSAANLFFRDVKYIVEVILMFGIFFTPVFYQASSFGKWGTFLLINPIGSLLESINSVVVLKQFPDPFWLGYALIASIVTFWFGMTFFHKQEPYFAENI